jgi:hypothetical protein
MTKVITFAKTFPSYHPKKGQPTNFRWKILRSLGIDLIIDPITNGQTSIENFEPKYTTIRAGQKWKPGDKFKAVEWALPGSYYTKGNYHVQIAPEIEVKKVWSFEIHKGLLYINGSTIICDWGTDNINVLSLEKQVAQNDGLEFGDLLNWFKYPVALLDHQIICWNEKINY